MADIDFSKQDSDEQSNLKVSLGAIFFNILRKTGATVSVEQFKAFEHDSVKFIYNHLGMLDLDEQLYNFTAFTNTFIRALQLAGQNQEPTSDIK